MRTSGPGTRERILEHGLKVMSQSGLSGVTLGMLADRVGMSKSGLFAHFDSKEDVQVALLQQVAAVAAALVVEPAMRAGEGLPRLKLLVKNWFGWAQRAGLPGGCPVAAGLFEFDDIEGRVRDCILAMEREWRGLLTHRVHDAIARGHLRKNLDADQFVWELCGIYLSHHAAHRFLRSADADRRADAAFKSLLEGALQPRVGRRTKRVRGK